MCEFITKLFKYEKGNGFSGLCCSFVSSFVALVSLLSFYRRKQDRKKGKRKKKNKNREYPVSSTY